MVGAKDNAFSLQFGFSLQLKSLAVHSFLQCQKSLLVTFPVHPLATRSDQIGNSVFQGIKRELNKEANDVLSLMNTDVNGYNQTLYRSVVQSSITIPASLSKSLTFFVIKIRLLKTAVVPISKSKSSNMLPLVFSLAFSLA
ncbi:hypothetical protein BDE36_2777 [Arcticibacter tournemirensis]|nr:hypothetical protein BDE36_2777 [Arcticibacter tournemirensis]